MKRRSKQGLIVLLGLVVAFVAVTARSSGPKEPRWSGRRILWIDSYHPGYEWSAAIGAGIRRQLRNSGIELRTVHMDSKRRSSEPEIERAAENVRAEIDAFDPDLVIASDDNAVKYLVVPYLKDTKLPVVFCGVNWDASVYGLPAGNVTGMVEQDPVATQVNHLARFAGGERIGYLSGDLFTERKIVEHYNRRFFAGRMKSYLVRSLDEFKQAFLRAQREVDMLYIANYAGIADWDPGAAEAFIAAHVRIPTGSHNAFMAPFALIAVAKDAEEQGEWAARTALRILAGARPADIPLARNEGSKLTVNLRMAKALDVVFPVSTLKAARVIGQEVLH